MADNLETRIAVLERPDNKEEIRVLQSELLNLRERLKERFDSVREATSLALASTNKATDVALETAKMAVAKADAAADKKYMEAALAALKDSSEDKIVALKDTIQAALNSAKEAVTKAEVSSDKRFDSVNEFRKSLADQTSTFIPRQEYLILHQSMMDRLDQNLARIDRLDKWQAEGTGKSAGISTVGAAIFSAVVGVCAIAGIILTLILRVH